ncbi:hypothetical protein [Streptosporangium sp. NPDC000396]|uniref:hypothetical protein n=1 Tax=Streptosporangium sp. NPDC000396 TaxID=3366185 RepID=UPI003695781C
MAPGLNRTVSLAGARPSTASTICVAGTGDKHGRPATERFGPGCPGRGVLVAEHHRSRG